MKTQKDTKTKKPIVERYFIILQKSIYYLKGKQLITKLAIKSQNQLKENYSNIEENMVKEFTKSLSNHSTTSIESGIFDMGISEDDKEKMEKINVGEAVEKILVEAKQENRLVHGFNSAIKFLNEPENPENTLFFFMAPARDHTTHMSSILLRAFCFENDIYIIQLDSAEKLSKVLNCEGITCALVQRSNTLSDIYNSYETILIDHCEDFWDEVVQPIIKLPEK